MEKIVEKELHTTTKLVTSADGKKTYRYTKELENAEGRQGIFIMMYPTRNEENFFVDDSTNVHIQNHIRDLGLKSYTVVNLFSKVTATRLSTRGLLPDDDNLEYLENEVFAKTDIAETDVIIAWGNSNQTSHTVNTVKKKVLKMWTSYHPENTLKQITAEGMPKEVAGAHPLYMGIRFNNAKWKLETYPYKKELKKLSEREVGGKKK